MSETYTITFEPVADGLAITIPELGIHITTPTTRRDEALDVAHKAIIAYLLEHDIRINDAPERPKRPKRANVQSVSQ